MKKIIYKKISLDLGRCFRHKRQSSQVWPRARFEREILRRSDQDRRHSASSRDFTLFARLSTGWLKPGTPPVAVTTMISAVAMNPARYTDKILLTEINP